MLKHAIAVSLLLLPRLASAETYKLYVAERDSPGHKAAEALADGKTSFWYPNLGKAFEKTTELLTKSDHEVRVLVAQGPLAGVLGLPNGLGSPKAKLLLLGGHCFDGKQGDWKKRDPFACPTELQGGDARSQPFLSFGGNKTQLAELVISGFVFDGGPANKYDAKTNTLLKGSSRTIPLLALSQVVVSHLAIADNVFLNSSHKAFELLFSPASNDAVADIDNNFFINNVIPLKFSPALYKGFKAKQVNFRHNTVAVNWPYNPDPTSSNVGALELYHKDCCSELNIEHNLFAHNPGGAMQHDWPTSRMGKLAIKHNLFYANAALWGDARGEAGVFTGKFGSSPKYNIVLLKAHMEDEFPYAFDGNVSFDPKVPVVLARLQGADSTNVHSKDTVMNDVRGLFGQNKDGGTVAVTNYAPRMALDLQHLPFPLEPNAGPFGVQRTHQFAAQ